MLPYELFALSLLAVGARAIPQLRHRQDANATTPLSTKSRATSDAGRIIHVESSVTNLQDPDPPTMMIPIIEVSETGLGFPKPTYTPSLSDSKTDVVLRTFMTTSATLAIAHTEITASITQLDPDNRPRPSNQPNNPNDPQTGHHDEDNPQSSGADLLHDIFTHLQPGSQPTSPPTTPPPGAPSSPADNAPSAPAITLGPSATLTLTPGLSTTLGANGEQTFVQLTTDGEGHTIITISSSGTVVSATVANVPPTLIVAGTSGAATRTGQGVAITNSASSDVRNSDGAGNGAAAETTASKGLASPGTRRSEHEWWLGIIGAVIGGLVA